jgi:hypothetical protein
MLSFLKAWILSFSSVEDVSIFECRGCYHFYCVNVIIFEFLDVIFLIVEDCFHDVNVMITINDNINDNTKCKRENDNIKFFITFADREK